MKSNDYAPKKGQKGLDQYSMQPKRNKNSENRVFCLPLLYENLMHPRILNNQFVGQFYEICIGLHVSFAAVYETKSLTKIFDTMLDYEC